MSNILVVDDEKDMCWTLCKFLGKEGYSTLSAQNGRAAMELVRKENIQLVLLDMQMPSPNGLTVLQEMRKIRPKLPIVLITGYGSPETAVKAIQLGANDYLAKPFDNRSLLDIVKRNENRNGTAFSSIKSQSDSIVFPEYLHQKLEDGKVRRPDSFLSPFIRRTGLRKTSFLTPVKILLALCMLILGLMIGSRMIYSPIIQNRFTNRIPLLVRNPSCMAFQGNQLWIADWVQQKMIIKNLSNLSRQVLPLKGIRPSGMVWVENHLFITDSWDKTILEFQFDPSYPQEPLHKVASYPAPGPKPSGITSDGVYLWTCDMDLSKIYKHKMDHHLTVIKEFNYPGKNPSGISWDGNTLWSVNLEQRLLIQHSMNQTLSIKQVYTAKHNFPYTGQLVSITFAKNSLWRLTENPTQLIQKRAWAIWGPNPYLLESE